MRGTISVLLGGDVMTGRGIDQVLPSPSDPDLHEPYMTSALGYVALAEEASGPIPRPADLSYIWGDAREELARAAPHATVVNLETAITRSAAPWPTKGVHYRMAPENAGCLAAAGIDCCALANNHTLDWGAGGLLETLDTLDILGIAHAGAGRTLRDAVAPAALPLGAGRQLLVVSLGSETSGIPLEWAAREDRPGVNLLEATAGDPVLSVAEEVERTRRDGDVVVASIHWGGNWEYGVDPAHRAFAHRLVSDAGVDIVHGHSSHHAKAIEVYRDRLILYGCGDLVTDYEGIRGYEGFRGDLGLLYRAELEPSGRLAGLQMMPMQMRRFQLRRPVEADCRWLEARLNREGQAFGTTVKRSPGGALALGWE